jgi:hypothetical protein
MRGIERAGFRKTEEVHGGTLQHKNTREIKGTDEWGECPSTKSPTDWM